MDYLKDKEAIMNWMSKHTDAHHSVIKIDDDFNVSVNNDIKIKSFTKTIDVKFAKINGNFDISYTDVKSTKNFPIWINGHLDASNGYIKKIENWNVEYVRKSINFASINSEIKNLYFLKDVEFGELFIEGGNNWFKDDEMPKEYREYFNTNCYDLTSIRQEAIQDMFERDIIRDTELEEVNNYFENYENELEIDM